MKTESSSIKYEFLSCTSLDFKVENILVAQNHDKMIIQLWDEFIECKNSPKQEVIEEMMSKENWSLKCLSANCPSETVVWATVSIPDKSFYQLSELIISFTATAANSVIDIYQFKLVRKTQYGLDW